MIEFVLIGVAWFFITWLLFINLMSIDRESVPKYMLPFAYAAFLVGGIMDMLFELIWAPFMFQQMTDFHKGMKLKDLLFTHRLRRILRGDTSIKVTDFRYKMAKFICKKLLSPWDKNHCGLEDIK